MENAETGRPDGGRTTGVPLGRGAPRPARVWMALAATPVILVGVFGAAALWLVGARGVPRQELPRALESIAAFPVTVAFGASFLVTRWLARRDGLTLRDIGWSRPGGLDIAIGAMTAAILWAANAFALYPVVQAAQPSFDPTLASLGLPAAVVMLTVATAAEDTLYRGYALVVLRGRRGTLAAAAITTVLYALLTPGDGVALRLWAAYFGAVLCALRLWRRNLWPVVIAHWAVALGPKLVAFAAG